jgi:hypothetical protein
MPKGFLGKFSTALKTPDFPVLPSQVRLAADPLTSSGAWGAAGCDVPRS